MPEEVLFKKEDRIIGAEVAKYLEEISQRIRDPQETTFKAGQQSTTVETPAKPFFRLKIERDTSISNGESKVKLNLELEWDENKEDKPKLEIS